MRKSVGCVRSKIDMHLEIFHKEVLIIKMILLILADKCILLLFSETFNNLQY
jgi:hypothetical protein